MLHPYATDSDERKQIPFIMGGLAILSAIGLWWVLEQINWPGWLDAPGTFGFYGIYYELFRRMLWKVSVFHKWGWVKVPVLTGKWRGHVATSFDDHQGKHSVEAEIRQNWTHIEIKLKSAYSKSHSVVGSILTSEDIVLDYEYFNEPLPNAAATMHAHRGTTSLLLSRDGMSFSGDYYSGRDRQNFGSIHLQKE